LAGMASQAPDMRNAAQPSQERRRSLVRAFVRAAGAGTGAVITAALILALGIWYAQRPLRSTNWQPVSFNSPSYLSEAIFSDLGVPNLRASGRVKFFAPPASVHEYRLGYEPKSPAKQ